MGCVMNSGRYFKVIIVSWCACGAFYNFAGGGSSKLNRVVAEIESGVPLLKRSVPDVIEMRPLLGPTASGAEWVVHYEPREPECWQDSDPPQDDWLEHMQEESELNKKFPTYGAMSTYPQYTVMSRSRQVLEIAPRADEDGMVRFVKNSTKMKSEAFCFDVFKQCFFIGYWVKNCFNPLLRAEQHGVNSRDKGNSLVRTE